MTTMVVCKPRRALPHTSARNILLKMFTFLRNLFSLLVSHLSSLYSFLLIRTPLVSTSNNKEVSHPQEVSVPPSVSPPQTTIPSDISPSPHSSLIFLRTSSDEKEVEVNGENGNYEQIYEGDLDKEKKYKPRGKSLQTVEETLPSLSLCASPQSWLKVITSSRVYWTPSGTLSALDRTLSSTNNQREKLVRLASSYQPREGDLAYLVSTRWLSRWMSHVNLDVNPFNQLSCNKSHQPAERQGTRTVTRSNPPGPIENEDLIQSDGMSMRTDLEHEVDFHVVDHQSWRKLFKWYNAKVVLPRHVIRLGKQLAIEVDQVNIRFVRSKEPLKVPFAVGKFSRLDKVKNITEQVGDLLGTDQFQLWDFNRNKHVRLICDTKLTLYESNIQPNQYIYIKET